MKIGKISTLNFKQIKIDEASYWKLRCHSSKEDIENLKKMSLKGVSQSCISFDPDWGKYGSCLLRGTRSTSDERFCIPLGEKPIAQNVENIINNFNRYA